MFDGEPNFTNNLQDHAFNTAVQILTIFVISNGVLITLLGHSWIHYFSDITNMENDSTVETNFFVKSEQTLVKKRTLKFRDGFWGFRFGIPKQFFFKNGT